MGRSDRRMLVGALCSISLALAAALVLGQPRGSLALLSHDLARDCWPHLRPLLARKNCATATQAVGALITFYGLGRVYVRAKYGLTIASWAKRGIKRLWAKLLHRPPEVAVRSGSAQGTFGLHVVAIGLVTHNVDITLSLQEQIKRLAQFVNNRSREAADMEKKITDLERELRQARDETSALERKALAHIETQIEQLSDRLDSIQVLDLRWAIWGLFVTFVGTVVSFGT